MPAIEPSHDPRDDLLVDVHDLGPVAKILTDLNVTYSPIRDDRLGLVRLADLCLAGENAQVVPIDADALAAILRRRAAAALDGWTPVIAVNHQDHAIVGDGLVMLESHKPMDRGEPQVPVGTLPAKVPEKPEHPDGIVVGVLDTKGPADGMDPIPFRAGHGLFVRSLIRREAPNATIRYVAVIDARSGRTNSWDVAQGIVELATGDDPVDVLNLSLGTYSAAGGPPLAIARAIDAAADSVLVVAAAGNHGALPGFVGGRTPGSACWPGAMPDVVAVGAVDAEGKRPPWSPNLDWIDCTALGVDVVADYLDGEVQLTKTEAPFAGFAVWSGTSFAAATVSGAIAARMGSQRVGARQAYEDLLRDSEVVRPFEPRPDSGT